MEFSDGRNYYFEYDGDTMTESIILIEQQLKPIFAYMKAHIAPTYVFIEEKDFVRKEILNDDVLFSLDRLTEDTVMVANAFAEIRAKKDVEYDF